MRRVPRFCSLRSAPALLLAIAAGLGLYASGGARALDAPPVSTPAAMTPAAAPTPANCALKAKR